jgi:hypothetical protein
MKIRLKIRRYILRKIGVYYKRGDYPMPNIKPISDLRNYSEVLRDVAVSSPVFFDEKR